LTQNELNFCYNIYWKATFIVRVETGLLESVGIKLFYGYAEEKDVKGGIVIYIVTIIECKNLT